MRYQSNLYLEQSKVPVANFRFSESYLGNPLFTCLYCQESNAEIRNFYERHVGHFVELNNWGKKLFF